MTSIVARRGDLTQSTARVVVNAGNTDLWLGSGVAGAINSAGGPEIQIELLRIRAIRMPRRIVPSWNDAGKRLKFPCDLGEVVVTHAGNMTADLVFHAAVMDCKGMYKAETSLDIIYECTRNCMLTARQYGVLGMAIPIFGTGVGGEDPEEALTAMLQAMHNYPISDFRIRIYGYTNDMYDLIVKNLR